MSDAHRPSPTKLVNALAKMATSIDTVTYKGHKCFRYIIDDPFGHTVIVRTTPCTFATKRVSDSTPNGIIETGLDWKGLEDALNYIGSCFDAAEHPFESALMPGCTLESHWTWDTGTDL